MIKKEVFVWKSDNGSSFLFSSLIVEQDRMEEHLCNWQHNQQILMGIESPYQVQYTWGIDRLSSK